MASIATIQGKLVAANVAPSAAIGGTAAANGTIDVKLPDSIAGGNGVITLEVAAGTLIAQLTVGNSVTIAITQP